MLDKIQKIKSYGLDELISNQKAFCAKQNQNSSQTKYYIYIKKNHINM